MKSYRKLLSSIEIHPDNSNCQIAFETIIYSVLDPLLSTSSPSKWQEKNTNKSLRHYSFMRGNVPAFSLYGSFLIIVTVRAQIVKMPGQFQYMPRQVIFSMIALMQHVYLGWRSLATSTAVSWTYVLSFVKKSIRTSHRNTCVNFQN